VLTELSSEHVHFVVIIGGSGEGDQGAVLAQNDRAGLFLAVGRVSVAREVGAGAAHQGAPPQGQVFAHVADRQRHVVGQRTSVLLAPQRLQLLRAQEGLHKNISIVIQNYNYIKTTVISSLKI